MAHGARIRNTNRTVVIDGTFKNLALVRKATLGVTGRPPGNGGTYRAQFVVAGTTPMLATYCAAGSVVVFLDSKVGNTYTYFIHCTVQADVEIYVFDEPAYATPYPVNYGFKVRNPSTAEVVFDSRMPYMRVLDFVYTHTPNGFNNWSRTYAAGLKCAVVQSRAFLESFYEIIEVGSPDPLTLTAVSSSSALTQGNVVQGLLTQVVANQPLPASQAPLYNYYSSMAAYLIVDVTGI